MKVALLGFPQAGKKTMFALLTGRVLQHPPKENEVVEGVAAVRDPRVDAIARILRRERIKYAELRLFLCPDVHLGVGQHSWLEAARRCDLLCLVVRQFRSAEVYHPEGSVDPERDRRSLEAELLLADLDLVEKRIERIGKDKKHGSISNIQALEEQALLKCKQALENSLPLRSATLAQHETAALKNLNLLTLAPVLWAYNVDEADLGQTMALKADEFRLSCRIEQEIMSIADDAERSEYLRSLGLEAPGIERLNQAAYDTMRLMSFYTMESDEVRAWTIRKGATAPEAAGKVHSDMERGFIRAEVIKYSDLVAAGSLEAVQKLGKANLKGKDYVIEDGDICRFRFNV
jgi:GTP-binding protein YchF